MCKRFGSKQPLETKQLNTLKASAREARSVAFFFLGRSEALAEWRDQLARNMDELGAELSFECPKRGGGIRVSRNPQVALKLAALGATGQVLEPRGPRLVPLAHLLGHAHLAAPLHGIFVDLLDSLRVGEGTPLAPRLQASEAAQGPWPAHSEQRREAEELKTQKPNGSGLGVQAGFALGSTCNPLPAILQQHAQEARPVLGQRDALVEHPLQVVDIVVKCSQGQTPLELTARGSMKSA